jgi:chorismate mutase / prephenate dehydratase
MSASNDIAKYRTQIDAIDVELLQLINRRAEIAQVIGNQKAAAGAAIYDPKREGQIIERMTVLNPGPLSVGAVQEIMSTIMGACREIQARG